jgi:vacuole morphology and inheritance protein 14
MAAESAQFQRLLVDAKAEARAKACSEITSRTAKSFTDVPPEEAYRSAIASLQSFETQFIRNANPAFRRGGMASVKATIAGVPNTTTTSLEKGGKRHNPEFVKMTADLVLPLLADVDPVVRISALETAHELVRKFQSQLFTTSFMELFRALHAVMMDKDRRCQALGRELSSAVREFVTGSESSAFSPEMFVSFITEAMEPLLAHGTTTTAGVTTTAELLDAQVMQWLLEWISHVYDLPNHELVLQLPRFLGHLYHLIARCPSPEAEKIMERSLQDAKRAYLQGLDINIRELMTTSLDCVNAIEVPATRKLALEWTAELLRLGGLKMLSLTHSLLDAILPQLSAKDLTIRIAAQNANGLLQQLLVENESVMASSQSVSTGVVPTSSSPPVHSDLSAQGGATTTAAFTQVAYYPVLQAMMTHLEVRSKEDTRIASLEWFLLIHGVRPDVVHDHFETMFEAILSTLGDVSENVMHKSVEVLHILAGEERFPYFIQLLLHHFELKAPILLPKAPTIIKQLQLRYQGAHDGFSTCEKLFLKIAELLPQRHDLRFVTKLVIVLNTMLLTSKELMPLREVLRKGTNDTRARDTLLGLYSCWCFDTTAAIALCLLTTAYSQAFRLVVLLGNSEISPQALVQVDRLVQLLESPVFSFLRVALLHPLENAALVKTMFGLQMLLPQASPQYKALHVRLKSVPSVAQMDLAVGAILGARAATTPSITAVDPQATAVDWDNLERHCVAVQTQLQAYEYTVRRQRT